MDKFDDEKSFASVTKLAKDEGCEELLQQYNKLYVQLLLRTRAEGSKPGKTEIDYRKYGRAALKSLRSSAMALAKINNMANSMDKNYFLELVQGGYMMRCGRSKSDGAQVFFLRVGEFEKGVWRLSPNSARGKAFIVAYQWFFITSTAACISYAIEEERQPILPMWIIDDGDRGCLDFNVRMTNASFSITRDLFPIATTKHVVFGTSTIVTIAVTSTSKVIPIQGLRMFSHHEYDRIGELVVPEAGSTHIAPDWFLEKGKKAKAYDASDRRNVFCFERLLQAKVQLCLRDIFNLQSYDWTASAADVSFLADVKISKQKLLAPIHESSEDTYEGGMEDDW